MFQEFEQYGLANVITRSGEVNPTELIVTLQKIRRRDIFGIEKYFAWGVEAQTRRVTASAQRAEVLEQAERYAARSVRHASGSPAGVRRVGRDRTAARRLTRLCAWHGGC